MEKNRRIIANSEDGASKNTALIWIKANLSVTKSPIEARAGNRMSLKHVSDVIEMT
jgi:hypothetical protein